MVPIVTEQGEVASDPPVAVGLVVLMEATALLVEATARLLVQGDHLLTVAGTGTVAAVALVAVTPVGRLTLARTLAAHTVVVVAAAAVTEVAV